MISTLPAQPEEPKLKCERCGYKTTDGKFMALHLKKYHPDVFEEIS